ncbi:MAG: hypothetical protein U1E58_06055 [Tabrizicola sp.]
MANDYLACVSFLQDAFEARALRLRFDSPILSNLSHATELAIKGHLLSVGASKDDLIKLGHDLAKGYRLLEKVAPKIVDEVEKHVTAQWRSFLRDKRDDLEDRFRTFGVHDPEHLQEMGVFSNEDIDNELPTFKRDLRWLSDRHKSNGSKFRYFEPTWDQRQHIRAFGLNVFTVPVSVTSGTKVLISLII